MKENLRALGAVLLIALFPYGFVYLMVDTAQPDYLEAGCAPGQVQKFDRFESRWIGPFPVQDRYFVCGDPLPPSECDQWNSACVEVAKTDKP